MIEKNILSQTPINQPIKEVPKKKSVLIPYLLGLVLVAILSGGGVYLWQKSEVNRKEITLNQIVTPMVTSVQGIIPTVSDNQTADWKTYKNEKYGLEFAYPSEFSSVRETIIKGETGIQFLIGFPNKTTKDGVDSQGFIVAGDSLDFSQGRSGWITDFQGYINNNGIIKLRSMFGGPGIAKENFVDLPKELVKSIFKNKNGVEIIMVTGKNYDNEMGNAVYGTAGEGRYNALINTNNNEIPGLIFIAPVGFSEDDFMKIVSSIKIQ